MLCDVALVETAREISLLLAQVFRKKVKRAKRHGEEKGVGGRGEEEGEGSDEESESDYSR